MNAQHNVHANGLSSLAEPAVSVESCDWGELASVADFDQLGLSLTPYLSLRARACVCVRVPPSPGREIWSIETPATGEAAVPGLAKLRDADTIIAADVVSTCSRTVL